MGHTVQAGEFQICLQVFPILGLDVRSTVNCTYLFLFEIKCVISAHVVKISQNDASSIILSVSDIQHMEVVAYIAK